MSDKKIVKILTVNLILWINFVVHIYEPYGKILNIHFQGKYSVWKIGTTKSYSHINFKLDTEEGSRDNRWFQVMESSFVSCIMWYIQSSSYMIMCSWKCPSTSCITSTVKEIPILWKLASSVNYFGTQFDDIFRYPNFLSHQL